MLAPLYLCSPPLLLFEGGISLLGHHLRSERTNIQKNTSYRPLKKKTSQERSKGPKRSSRMKNIINYGRKKRREMNKLTIDKEELRFLTATRRHWHNVKRKKNLFNAMFNCASNWGTSGVHL